VQRFAAAQAAGPEPRRRVGAGRHSTAIALAALSLDTTLSGAVAGERQCPASPHQIVIEKSLIVRSPDFFAQADFSFARTIDSILASLAIDPDANRVGFVQTLLDTYDIDRQNNPDSMLPMPIEKQQDNELPTADELLDATSGLQPVALINRLDRAPRDGANCGEYRIVYALETGGFFLNFEAVLPNPEPLLGIAACMPVAEFWSALSERTVDQMAGDLEAFYYDGLGSGFVAAVLAENFGIPDGQIRGNVTLNGPEHWQLREWKVEGAAFRVHTTKNNPLVELYGDDSTGAIDKNVQELQRHAYQQAFVDQYLLQLFEPDLRMANVVPGNDAMIEEYISVVLNEFGAEIGNQFNEFQSISSNSEDDPALKAEGIRPRIDLALSQSGASLQGVTTDEALARAGAITCGGCHEFSNGDTLGHVADREIKWPNSRGFVHIDENGNISPALEKVNLPWRRQKLYEMLCTEPKQPERGFEEELALKNDLAELLTALIEKKASLDAQETRNRFRSLVDTLTRIHLEKEGYFVRHRRTH
jgi:hypothetical protein